MLPITFLLTATSVIAVAIHDPAQYNAVPYDSITSLTFTKGSMTTGRRFAPQLQLQCTGGNDPAFIPEKIHCKRLLDMDSDWQCTALLPDDHVLANVDVNCEGYRYPDDDNILEGSCALRYEMWKLSPHQAKKRKIASKIFKVLSLVFTFGILGTMLYKVCGRRHGPERMPSRDTDDNDNDDPPPPYPGSGPGKDIFKSSAGVGSVIRPGTSTPIIPDPPSSDTRYGPHDDPLSPLVRNPQRSRQTTPPQRRISRPSSGSTSNSGTLRTSTSYGTSSRR